MLDAARDEKPPGGGDGHVAKSGRGTNLLRCVLVGWVRACASVLPEGPMAVVLVVEDEPTVMLLVDGIVSGSRRKTLTASNGGAALAVIGREAPIELLFTDISLGDGAEWPGPCQCGACEMA